MCHGQRSLEPQTYWRISLSTLLRDTLLFESQMCNFVQSFFTKFPSFKFYLTGESYGGHYLPITTYYLWNQQLTATSDQFINFKGFMVGNPLTDAVNDAIASYQKLWFDSMVPIDAYKSWMLSCSSPSNFLGDTCLLQIAQFDCHSIG
jgi:hypothetical protein